MFEHLNFGLPSPSLRKPQPRDLYPCQLQTLNVLPEERLDMASDQRWAVLLRTALEGR